MTPRMTHFSGEACMRSLSVRALDLYLNRRILDSPRGDAWWRIKIRAKRLLALADRRDVERLARRILRTLRQRPAAQQRAA